MRISNVIDALAGERRPGLLFVDSYGHRRDYTFAEVSELSQRYAAAFRELNTAQGQPVLVCTSNTAKTHFIMLALARLGARAVPCSEDAQPSEILRLALQCNASAIVANRKRRASIESLQADLPPEIRYVLIGEECEGWARLDTLAAAAKRNAGPAAAGDGEKPTAAIAVLEAASEDRVWCSIPMGSDLWPAYVHAPWWSGAATIVHESAFDARERLDLVRELEVTVLLQPPEEFAAQVDLPDVDRFRLPYLRRCIATAQTDGEIERRWAERFGVPLSIVYATA